MLEWAGWRIMWRHGGAPPSFDGAWRTAFLAGTARTFAGALGVGGAVAIVIVSLARVLSWERAQTRRRTRVAFVFGVVCAMALLGALTLWAP